MNFVDARVEQPAPRPPSARFWPGFVLALIACQMIACGVTIYLATSDPTFAVEPDYYASAVKWDAHAAQARANRELGWTLEFYVSPLEGPLRQRALNCVVRQRDGAPIRDAEIELIAFPHSRATERQVLALRDHGHGTHAGSLRVNRTGLWELRATVRSGGALLTDVRRVEIGNAVGSAP